MSDQNELQVLDLTRQIDVREFKEVVKHNILEGEIDIVSAAVVLKRMSKASDELLKDKEVKEAIEEAFTPYLEDGKKAEVHGASVSRSAVYTFYDFSVCGHPEYDALAQIAEGVKTRMKEIEEQLKALIKPDNAGTVPGLGIPSSGADVIIQGVPEINYVESGEVVHLEPPKKIQKMGLKFNKV